LVALTPDIILAWRLKEAWTSLKDILAFRRAQSHSMNDNGAVELPTALPLFATGLGALGLLSWRRKRKAAAPAA
jgi:hypothetical protein